MPRSTKMCIRDSYNTEQELGTMPTILYYKGLVFTPSEIDISIRPGWFWHEKEEPHSLARLFHTYLTSVGANACPVSYTHLFIEVQNTGVRLDG